MIKVDPFSPEGVYDTLLELRLQDWAHEQDPGVKTCFVQSVNIPHIYLSHYIMLLLTTSAPVKADGELCRFLKNLTFLLI